MAGQNPRSGPNFVTPRTGLQIRVEEYAVEEDTDGVANYPGMMAEMAEQVDNPYLLHYKNKSKVLKQELLGQQNMPITPNATGEGQRDPEEEFFMLAVLAHKMLHNELYDESEYVYQVSAAKLFKQVRDKKLPFHRWYKWLEDNFAELRTTFMKNSGNDQQANYDHLSASDEMFGALERRSPVGQKAKGPSLLSKLKQAMTKKDGQGISRLSFGRRSIKKSNSEQVTFNKEKEHTLQTISEAIQEKAD